jgi:hypothetical protein
MTERRQGVRSRSVHRGTIAYGAISRINCVIRIFAAAGARLELQHPSNVPDRFDLIVDGNQAVLSCRVKWRDGSNQSIGVQFELQNSKRPLAAASEAD